MQKRILLTCFLMVWVPLVSFATFRPVATVSTGLANANVFSSKLINFSPFQNLYIGNNHYDAQFDLGLFLGGEIIFQQNWAWQIGISYFRSNPFQENGNVYQFNDSSFNNLTYQYFIQNRRLSIETKLSHEFKQIWHPYFSASIGKSCNKAFQYTEYPVTSADVPMTQPFANHATTTWAYSLGFGIDIDIAEHWRAGAGYRFLNLGSASLGVSSLQSGNETISNSPIHANEILAQISYIV